MYKIVQVGRFVLSLKDNAYVGELDLGREVIKDKVSNTVRGEPKEG